jgi:Organic solute transporter Ostalpha
MYVSCNVSDGRVPLYGVASWWGLKNFTVASIIDPVRDIYEGFVIYCFFELLVNYLGGERAIMYIF